MTTCTCGYHAPEQHGPSGCTMLGCDCKWDGKPEAKSAPTIKEALAHVLTCETAHCCGSPVVDIALIRSALTAAESELAAANLDAAELRKAVEKGMRERFDLSEQLKALKSSPSDDNRPAAAVDLDTLRKVAEATKAARLAFVNCKESAHNMMAATLKQSDMLTTDMRLKEACTESVILQLIAELTELRAASRMKPFWFDDSSPIGEGQSYLFAVQTDGETCYFVDAIVWDAETPAEWSNGEHGWTIDDVTYYSPLPAAPVST